MQLYNEGDELFIDDKPIASLAEGPNHIFIGIDSADVPDRVAIKLERHQVEKLRNHLNNLLNIWGSSND